MSTTTKHTDHATLFASNWKGENKATFTFGKVDGYGHGRKDCEMRVEICLSNRDGKPEFTASGEIRNNRGTDCIRGGQCLDDPLFAERAKASPFLAELVRLWRSYHLNGMNAGTIEQSAALAEMPADFIPDGCKPWDHYTRACAWLKVRGLYEVPDPRDPSKLYRYGAAWLYREIPAADLEKIRGILADARAEVERRRA